MEQPGGPSRHGDLFGDPKPGVVANPFFAASRGTAPAPSASLPVCASFKNQLYRPALCQHCFHTIGEHFPGQWVEETSDARVFFRNVATGELLFARPAPAELTSMVVRLREAAAASLRRSAWDELQGAGPGVAESASAWDAKWGAPAGPPPPPPAAARTAAGGGGGGGRPPPPPALAPLAPGGGAGENDALPQGPPPPGMSPHATAAVDHFLSPLRPAPLGAAGALPGAAAEEEDAPAAGADEGSPLQHAPLLPLRKPATPAAAAPLLLPPPPPSPPAAAAAPPLPPPAPAPEPAWAPCEEGGATAAGEGESFVGATAATDGSPPAPAVPLSEAPLTPHLCPLSDPLCVDLRALSATAGGGVVTFRARQAYDDTYGALRYLVVTPTTLAAVAPHPTRIGVGVLKWERSLLSLASLISQPLFRPLDARAPAGGAAAAAGSADKSAAMLEADAETLDGGGGAVVNDLPFSSGGGGGGGSGGGGGGGDGLRGFLSRMLGGGGGKGEGGARPQRMYGVGLLVSFLPEKAASLPLLRVHRAGLRAPAAKAGWLLKRKRAAWRENAPLGPLAWKKRHFVLEEEALLYFKAGSGGTMEAKGAVPLAGWVEVASTGAPAGRPGGGVAFLVRTGTTSHSFQAASEGDAAAWMAAIAVNAQRCGTAQHDPQCVILATHGDAAALAGAIRARREALLARVRAGTAPPPLAAALDAWRGADFLVDLSASEAMAAAAASRAAAPPPAAAAQPNPPAFWGALPAEDHADPQPPPPPARPLAYAASPFFASTTAPAPAPQQPLAPPPPYAPPPPPPPLPSPHAPHHHRAPPFPPSQFAAPNAGASGAGGLTVAEAEVLASALGGVTEEFLAQLPPHVAHALCAVRGMVSPYARAAPLQSAPPPPLLPQQQPQQLLLKPPPLPPGVAPTAGGGGGGGARDCSWQYVDDAGVPQGPFPGAAMRGWLAAGYFAGTLRVRCAEPLPPACVGRLMQSCSLSGSAPVGEWVTHGAAAAGGAPSFAFAARFLPLATLFPNPRDAFAPEAPGRSYETAAGFNALLGWAVATGLGERRALQRAVDAMAQQGLQPDPGLLLDLLPQLTA
jgi:hypothetical protein